MFNESKNWKTVKDHLVSCEPKKMFVAYREQVWNQQKEILIVSNHTL